MNKQLTQSGNKTRDTHRLVNSSPRVARRRINLEVVWWSCCRFVQLLEMTGSVSALAEPKACARLACEFK
jgi:hypothetical protein